MILRVNTFTFEFTYRRYVSFGQIFTTYSKKWALS